MSKSHYLSLFLSLLCFIQTIKPYAQTTPPTPHYPIPSEAQLCWHEMEQYAFIHFTINTFTNKEWGYGDESSMRFNPQQLDVQQWVDVIKKAGLKGIILTCKHHDGFCLWPSAFTTHDVQNSPWLEGRGDLVKMVSDACAENGLKFGVYLSPWDRNHPDYGTKAYIDYYRNQAKELATSYGPLFEWWLDGANGGDGFYGGAREIRRIAGKSYYDWSNTIEMIGSMQPNTLFFSDAGPHIRWVGNESGIAGATNWNGLTTDTLYPGKPGISDLLQIGDREGKNWIPAEVDVSIRPGWFYHSHEDSLVKTPEQLFDIYLSSVGRGANLLLNIPPDRRGIIHENDVKALTGWKQMIDKAFAFNLAEKATVSTSSFRGNDPRYSARNLTDNNHETYWTTDDDLHSGTIIIEFAKTTRVQYILLQEYIRLGQRIDEVEIAIPDRDEWKTLATATTIGYKRIIEIPSTEIKSIRIQVKSSVACPVVSNIGIY